MTYKYIYRRSFLLLTHPLNHKSIFICFDFQQFKNCVTLFKHPRSKLLYVWIKISISCYDLQFISWAGLNSPSKWYFRWKEQETHLSCRNLLKSATCMDVNSILDYTDDDKSEITMPKQIDVKVTKPQNKHGHGTTRKCPLGYVFHILMNVLCGVPKGHSFFSAMSVMRFCTWQHFVSLFGAQVPILLGKISSLWDLQLILCMLIKVILSNPFAVLYNCTCLFLGVLIGIPHPRPV